MSSIAFPLRDGRELAPGNDGANLTMNPSGCISSEAIHKPLDVWRQTNWFAIHAKPRREGFASTGLSAVNIEILFPRVRVERLIRGAAQQGTKPLFPGYFFARFWPHAVF
jgi:hypothetical protein